MNILKRKYSIEDNLLDGYNSTDIKMISIN
jgi:hypothetical protein